MNFNKVILIGRLTRDPENKALTSGQSLTSFGLATNRYYNDKNGQKQEQTDFHNIVVFGKLAETASRYLSKGSLALIEGRIQTRSWQDKDGNKAYRTEIIGERIQLGPRASNTNNLNKSEKPDPQRLSDEIPVIEEDEEIDVKDIPF
jgi:single-strand DNA-binding protein